MRIDILTLFPEMFTAVLGTSIPKRAAEKGLVEYRFTNIRDFATDAHKSVDDKPFGGGPGMVLLAEQVVIGQRYASRAAIVTGLRTELEEGRFEPERLGLIHADGARAAEILHRLADAGLYGLRVE